MSRDGRSARFRFGVHQGLEYLIAALVVSTAIRLRTGLAAPVLGAGVAILALAAVTDGPLCATRWLSRQAHAVADWLIVAGLAVLPFAALELDEDLPAALVVWMAAAFLAFLASSTDYRRRQERRSAPPARAAPPGTGGGSESLNSVARALGRQAGRAPRSLGRAVGRYKTRRTR